MTGPPLALRTPSYSCPTESGRVGAVFFSFSVGGGRRDWSDGAQRGAQEFEQIAVKKRCRGYLAH